MAITKEEARPGTQVLIRARVDRSTSEGEHGTRSVICWVANPLAQRRGDREVSVVCDPDDVATEASYSVGVYIGEDDDLDALENPAEQHPAEALLSRILAAALDDEQEPGEATIRVDLTGPAPELYVGHELLGDEGQTVGFAIDGELELTEAELEYLSPLVASLRSTITA